MHNCKFWPICYLKSNARTELVFQNLFPVRFQMAHMPIKKQLKETLRCRKSVMKDLQQGAVTGEKSERNVGAKWAECHNQVKL